MLPQIAWSDLLSTTVMGTTLELLKGGKARDPHAESEA
jgi:hypothetical protein